MVSVGYLALTRMPESAAALKTGGAGFEPWYRFFPWEDWREKRPAILDTIIPLLSEWKAPSHGELGRALGWRERLRLCFGVGGSPWDEEKVLERYIPTLTIIGGATVGALAAFADMIGTVGQGEPSGSSPI